MRAIVYHGANDLRLETVPVPRIGAGDLLVKVAVCGVCPTDIKKIQYGTVPPPRIFGHETSGTIVRVGSNLRQFRVGQRVALHHHVPCLHCHACRHRAFAQCPQYKRTGITAGFEPAGGGYAEYVRVLPFVLPGVVSIPARNSFLEGAMLEPVNTVLKAVKRLALLRGDTVLVAGQGPIGLIFTRLLTLRGMRVVATDLIPKRLALARQFGANTLHGPACALRAAARQATHLSRRSRTKADLSRRLVPPKSDEGGSRITHHAPVAPKSDEGGSRSPFDAAVIAAPSDQLVRQAQEQVRGGGQVLLFSHTRRGGWTELDLAAICTDEKDLIGSYSSDFLLQAEVARLVFSRKLDVRKLITHQFPLDQTPAAIALAARPTSDSLKVVVNQER